MSEDDDSEPTGRVTSPMQGYSGTDVIVGIVVLSIGMFLVAGLPYVF
ncbi:MAG: hypothetical protein ABEJ76_07655 [Halanaeroarchaeum sp.]